MEKSAFQPTPKPLRKRPASLATIIVFAALLLSPSPAHPQGCAQCQDNAAATPPATQRAYRHAIILLTLTATGLFVATLAIFKRHR